MELSEPSDTHYNSSQHTPTIDHRSLHETPGFDEPNQNDAAHNENGKSVSDFRRSANTIKEKTVNYLP